MSTRLTTRPRAHHQGIAPTTPTIHPRTNPLTHSLTNPSTSQPISTASHPFTNQTRARQSTRPVPGDRPARAISIDRSIERFMLQRAGGPADGRVGLPASGRAASDGRTSGPPAGERVARLASGRFILRAANTQRARSCYCIVHRPSVARCIALCKDMDYSGSEVVYRYG